MHGKRVCLQLTEKPSVTCPYALRWIANQYLSLKNLFKFYAKHDSLESTRLLLIDEEKETRRKLFSELDSVIDGLNKSMHSRSLLYSL